MTIETAAGWDAAYRARTWAALDQPWELIVAGGGITGAGIAREAARAGLRVLVVDQRDWGWGTSSRSSKLVHGGLRYLAQGEIGLTRDSVRERERLLAESAGLVTPLGFLIAIPRGGRLKGWFYRTGLIVYDLLAGRLSHQVLDGLAVRSMSPHIAEDALIGGLRYVDAQVDDARLVLRVLREAVRDGATALNYAAVTGLLRDGDAVSGVRLRDAVSGAEAEVRAQVVVNATGVWADRLRGEIAAPARMRPLRGSHLMFAAWRLPVAQAVNIAHPADGRPVFVLPWEGATLVGTTDLDHRDSLDREPSISPGEVAYLMAAVDQIFPALNLGLDDIVSTWSGVRPVVGDSPGVGGGDGAPSDASREHVVWREHGLLTVTGGKLTTFRLIARDALGEIADRFPVLAQAAAAPALDPAPRPEELGVQLNRNAAQRLIGRYGADAAAFVASARPDELRLIPGTPTLWAELRWAARAEGVIHLDDLLLRRVRIGLLLPEGAAAFLPAIRAICQPELGWDDARWEREEAAYRELVKACYGVPANVPAWRPTFQPAVQIAAALTRNLPAAPGKRLVPLALGGLAALALWRCWRQMRGGLA